MREPGIYENVPEDEYHASEGVSVSYLKVHAQAPAKARYGERKETEALKLGSLIHCAVTEPDKLERRYAATDLDRSGTKAWIEAERKAAGRVLIKRDAMDDAKRIRDAVFLHPVARELLTAPGPVEASFWWIDPETGVLCRGRADKIIPGMRVLADLKSTEDASPRGFARTAENYLYDWQAAMYVDGINEAPGGFAAEAFVYLAIEKEPPFLVGAYEILPEHVERARAQVALQLADYRQCEMADHWPGYSETLEPLAISARADFR